MNDSVVRRVSGRAMQPDEVRAAREANGWSVEAFADAMWVTPLEVEAWEAGSVAPSPAEARWIRWHGEMGERDRALAQAGLNPCAWVRERRAQYPPERRGSHPSDVSRWPEIELHVSQCPACGALPRAELRRVPLPEPPRDEGEGIADWFIRHWRAAEHLPARERLVAQVLVPAGVMGGGVLLVDMSVEGGFAGLPWAGFLTCMAGYLAFLATSRPMRGFTEGHPWLAWLMRTAAVLYSMLLVAGAVLPDLALNDPLVWILTGGFSLLIGGLAGAVAADAGNRDEYLERCVALTLAPAPGADGPEEP